jgi:outer membrane protein insertion porin family
MPLTRRIGGAALALVASAFVAPSAAAQQQTPPKVDLSPTPEIRSLQLNGVHSVDADELRQNIYTTATSCKSLILWPICRFSHWRALENRHYFDKQEFQRDVLRIRVFYFKRGFRETEVDTSVTRLNEKEVAVRFDILEGPPTVVTEVTVAQDSVLFSARRQRRLTLLKAGQPLDLLKMDSTKVGFTNELWDLGYGDALVDTSSIVDPVARTAQVQFRLVPNHVTRVGQIVVNGADEISPTTVLNSLTFRTGDLYQRSTILESQRNLYESNLFRLATIQVPETFDSIKTVNVNLREARLHEARLSGGFNTVDYVQTEGRFTHYNLLGGARRLDLTATVGNLFANSLDGWFIFRQQTVDTSLTGNPDEFLKPTWQTNIQFTQPAFLRRPRNSLSFGAFAQRRAVPAVAIDRGYGGNITYTRSLGLRAPLSFGYVFAVTNVLADDAYFCVNFGVCDRVTIDNLRSHQKLSPVLVRALVDRTDQPLNPSRGYAATATAEYASQGTISDYSYSRLFGQWTTYNRVGPRRNVLATLLRLGWVRAYTGPNGDAVLHPSKRFYAGGSQSVRGFGENQLGPRILTLPHGFLTYARTASGGLCDASSAAIRFCDPNTARDSTGTHPLVGDDKFTPQPLGGTSLLEGSVEYRFPLPFIKNLGGAVFIDGAAVGERVFDPLAGGIATFKNLVSGTGAITPGFGIRYYSPVGPIRVDLGINPSQSEDLAVVTQLAGSKGTLVTLDIPRRYSPTAGAGTAIGKVLNRLTLHLSIGQAY